MTILKMLVLTLTVVAAAGMQLPSSYVAGTLIQLNDNGAWSRFMDERAIVHDGKLIVGGIYEHNRGEWNTKVVALILP